MVRLNLLILRWVIETRHKAEEVWSSHALGMWIVCIGMIVAAGLLYWPPAPGIGVAIMGLAAALMAARKEPTAWEKAAWTFMMFALLVVEVLAIRKDRVEHDEQLASLLREEVGARRDAKANFENIGEGIKREVAERQKGFEATIRRNDSILRGVSESIKIANGGDSFCYVRMEDEGIYMRKVRLVNKGIYDVFNVEAAIIDQTPDPIAGQGGNRTKVYPSVTVVPKGGDHFLDYYSLYFMNNLPDPMKDRKRYYIIIKSRNSEVNEVLTLKRVNSVWRQAIIVLASYYGDKRQYLVLEDIDEAFPKNELKQDPDWVRRERTYPKHHVLDR